VYVSNREASLFFLKIWIKFAVKLDPEELKSKFSQTQAFALLDPPVSGSYTYGFILFCDSRQKSAFNSLAFPCSQTFSHKSPLLLSVDGRCLL